MKLAHPPCRFAGRPDGRGTSAFTVLELLVASTVALMVVGGAMLYMYFGGLAVSGITAQTFIGAQAGNTVEMIQMRARLATSAAADGAGNILTFGYDDDPTVDSDGDGKAYNDQNHFEQFQYLSVTNGAAVTNSLVYIPDTRSTNQRVLIASGLRKLPGWNVFTVTNVSTALIRLGIVDTYARDHFQSIEIQAAAVPLNRPTPTNVISILPF